MIELWLQGWWGLFLELRNQSCSWMALYEHNGHTLKVKSCLLHDSYLMGVAGKRNLWFDLPKSIKYFITLRYIMYTEICGDVAWLIAPIDITDQFLADITLSRKVFIMPVGGISSYSYFLVNNWLSENMFWLCEGGCFITLNLYLNLCLVVNIIVLMFTLYVAVDLIDGQVLV
jgi:hypothetical protein